VNLKAQSYRYPRSRSCPQSANSSQKAKRPSSGKQKISSFSSYTNSDTPFAVRYLSILYRLSGRRPILASGRLVGLLSVGSMTPRAWKLVSAFSTIPAQVLCVLEG
jgi:hypothetical protein